MTDDIKLPALPKPDHGFWDVEGDWCARNAYEPGTVKEYARAAVLADRERRKKELNVLQAGLKEAWSMIESRIDEVMPGILDGTPGADELHGFLSEVAEVMVAAIVAARAAGGE